MNGFDCLQNALKTKQSRDLKGSFEAENEIISFCFQEVTELLRNSKERKKSKHSVQEIVRRPEGGNERREIPKKSSATKSRLLQQPH